MDLKNILDDQEDKEGIKNNPNVKVYKKPIQLKDIERRSRNNVLKDNKDSNDISDIDINKLIDIEKGKIFNQTWNKLDNGSKINRLLLYSETLKVEYDLSDDEKNKLNKLLKNACNKNKLNKISEVIYDNENCVITHIKSLIFNNDNRIFSLNINETKAKTKNNSKTNIERLLKQ